MGCRKEKSKKFQAKQSSMCAKSSLWRLAGYGARQFGHSKKLSSNRLMTFEGDVGPRGSSIVRRSKSSLSYELGSEKRAHVCL